MLPLQHPTLGGGARKPAGIARTRLGAYLWTRRITARRRTLSKQNPVARYRTNLQGEMDSAALYHALAEAESNPQLKQVYSRLAAVEEAHAEFWKKRLSGLGASARGRGPGWRSRMLAWAARRFGPELVLPLVNSLERGGFRQIRRAARGGLRWIAGR